MDAGAAHLADLFSPGDAGELAEIDSAELHLVPAEDVILFAARAVGALEAAHEQHRHSQGDQDGQHTCIRRNPVK